MLNELNPEQLAGLDIVRDEYIAKGHSTYQLTDAEATELMGAVYKAGGLSAPKQVIVVDSPLAMFAKYKEITNASDADVKDQLSNVCYGSLSAGWFSYYAYFLRYAKDQIDGLDQIEPLTNLVGKLSSYLPYEDLAIVSRNPISIKIVDGVLHSLDGPAFEYADGMRGYSLWGTEISEEQLAYVNTKNVAEVLRTANVEQRLVLIRALGAGNMLNELGAKEIDSHEHEFRAKGPRADLKEVALSAIGYSGDEVKQSEYTLFAVTLPGADEVDKLLRMRNPSERKWHYEWVSPECKTVEQAMAFRMPSRVLGGKFVWPSVKA